MKTTAAVASVTVRRFANSSWRPVTVTNGNSFDTGIKIYNCVAKADVPLVVRNKHCVTWYTCGPTVYDDAHIGHASCYMRIDILQRILRRHFGLNIVSAMNITDVDDKIIMRSNVAKIPFNQLAKHYESRFWHDLKSLRISGHQKVLRVSEHIDDIVNFIQQLIHTQFAYHANDGSIYFDVKAYQRMHEDVKYGKLENIAPGPEAEAEVEDGPNVTKENNKNKKNVQDFALWKAAKVNEPSWESPFGPGRPGWHIECSAMASTFLGNPIDIHAGGIDLRFPHHENEEAQSCAYHRCSQWVNYWLHVGHLHLANDSKMSKSLNNTVSISDLLATCTPDVFRMSCLLSPYRSNMEYSLDRIKLAESHVKTLSNFLNNINISDNYYSYSSAPAPDLNQQVLLSALASSSDSVNAALCRNFDTAACIKILQHLMTECNKVINAAPSASGSKTKTTSLACLAAVGSYVRHVLDIFGLQMQTGSDSVGVDGDGETKFSEAMDVLVRFRHQVRMMALAKKDSEALSLCDETRDECRDKLGVSLSDKVKISSWGRV